MTSDTRPFFADEFLDDDAALAAYLDDILADPQPPEIVAAALGDVARAKGMTLIARETGLSRESLYRALSARGNPEFATVAAVLKALNLRLSVVPAGPRSAQPDAAA